jgi:hypothetical protein
MTGKSGGTGINLDDKDGGHPTLLIVLAPDYSAKELDQLLGRVSRKTTKSEATVMMLTSESWADTHRSSVTNEKLGILQAIQGGGDIDVELNHSESEETDSAPFMSEELLKSVERRKDLIAFHNVSADRLKGVDELGGMAVPSFAVTKDTIGGNKFGEITLLVRPKTIDPKRRGNKI